MNSSDYYNLYLKYEKEVTKYTNNISYISGLKEKISSGLSNYLNSVNNEIVPLKDRLREAVRYDDIWKQNTEKVDDKKEQSYIKDSNISSAVSSLNSELDSLNSKKRIAEENRDDALRNYNIKKEEEYQEYLREQERLKQLEAEKKEEKCTK